ncbi:MAG: CZB domain-containing protein [Methylococcales bacterium]|nr:CZB domain-containing protein [Methylococcales bacterium]
MSNLDISMAKISHLDWKSKLIDFIYGFSDLQLSDLSSHLECDFGKWLYNSGLEEFSHLSIMKTIEVEHKAIHDDIKRIVALPKESREGELGQHEIDTFKVKCDSLIYLLDQLKVQI